MSGAPDAAVREALTVLDKRRLVLAIHDASFPDAGAPADPGRGTPYSEAAFGFLRFVRGLGFDGIMLGPQGMVTRANPSPYDSTAFSRNILNIDFGALAADPPWDEWSAGAVGQSGAGSSGRVRHAAAYDRQLAQLTRLHERFGQARARDAPQARRVDAELRAFRRAQRRWLEPDALYAALTERHRGAHHRDWPERIERRLLWPAAADVSATRLRRRHLRAELTAAIERYALGQLLVHRQHARFRARAAGLGLRLYGDLQIGLSAADAWQHERLFLRGYRLGAPPSRTNPAGQPWGYHLLAPDRYRGARGQPGPALRFLRARIGKLLEEYDGLRIDHPHGLVCPWVYRADDPDPYRAVRSGARLFDSPQLADHPELARYAIARPEQLAGEGAAERHADDWVRALDPAQLARYGRLLQVVLDALRARGAGPDDLACEVLSTCPYPLARLLAEHGLGRFRVTQKADVAVPQDVYRSENAQPQDWVMVGTHDTAPIWRLARSWSGHAAGREQADYLARRLRPEGGSAALAAALAADPARLAEAKFADVFASRARHVLVFFPDLLGLEDVYNEPGTVHEDNWSLRVPPDYVQRYRAGRERGQVLSLPRVLALALRARGHAFAAAHRGLLARLDGLRV